MKKIFALLALVLLISGCTINPKYDLDEVTDKVLTSNENLINQYYSGYQYYLPRGVKLIHKLDYNTTFLYNSNKIYLYVDVVSYYHKAKEEYEENKDIYFSKVLNYDDKQGYINITKNDEEYYINIEYNYGKIETYTKEKDLTNTVINSLYILKSLKFNDVVIDSLIGENKIEYKEEQFDLFKSDTDDGYLDIIDDKDKYENGENEDFLVDEDKIIIEVEEELNK